MKLSAKETIQIEIDPETGIYSAVFNYVNKERASSVLRDLADKLDDENYVENSGLEVEKS